MEASTVKTEDVVVDVDTDDLATQQDYSCGRRHPRLMCTWYLPEILR